MAKKKAAATKVTAEELKNIQDKVNDINRVQMEVGGLEVQKNLAIERLKQGQSALNIVQQGLEKKYGKVSVNINDGSLKPIVDEADKKN
jgi:hypothetical protein